MRFGRYFKGVYLEPQLGYGIYSARATVSGISGSDSDGAFAWAIGGGGSMGKGLDVGSAIRILQRMEKALHGSVCDWDTIFLLANN